ncbi:MAG: two-component system sensor histidine kinase CreC [Thermoanaerobaculia bacterium]|nr:two-component system sensor histidine kinase CreC [Thermoanaerobaculia bacterium]
MSIRRRLALAYLLITAGGFLYLVRWVVADIRPYYLTSIEESLVDTSRVLASLLAGNVREDRIDAGGLHELLARAYQTRVSARIYEKVKTELDLRAYVTDSRGIVLFDSHGGKEGADFSRWNDVYLTLRGKYGARTTRDDPADPASAVIWVASPIVHQGKTIGVLSLGRPIRSIDRIASTTIERIVIGGTVAAFVVILLLYLLTVWFTRPIGQLMDYARRVRDGRPASLPVLGDTDLGRLGTAFEEMRQALEGRKYVEHYVETLTHALKSPLSAIRGAAELMREEMPAARREKFLGNVLLESDRMQKVIDQLLRLSVLENQGRLGTVAAVDLASLAREVSESSASHLERRSISLRLALEEARVDGDAFLLKQAIANLLQNAIEFSGTGTAIELRTGVEGGQALVEIADEGPGIPAYAREKVFEKFYSLPRPETGAKSSGLGLPIVRQVARLHRGEIELENRPQRGLKARLKLPIASPDPGKLVS